MDATLDAAVLEPTDDLELDQPQDTPDPAAETQETSPEDRLDGRKFNPEWSKEFKSLREMFPEKADMLTKWRDSIARYGAVSELAPKGVDDIRQWKTTIDAIGGPEAAAQLMERAANIEQIDSRIAASDFSVVGELPEEMQKGFYGMIPDALTNLAESNPAAFSAAVAPHFQKALADTGLGDVLNGQVEGLRRIYASTTDPETRALIQSLFGDASKAKDWYARQTSGAGSMPGGSKTVDPQVTRLQAELESRRQADDEGFVKSTSDAAVRYKDEQYSKLSAPYIKSLGLTETQQADLKESYDVKIVNALAADTAFQAQLKAYKSLKTRTPEQVNAYISAHVDKYAKQVLDGIVTARYSGRKARTTPAADTTATTTTGATRVAQAPPQSDWDMDKMEAEGYENTAKRGIFHLKGGRTVQLARPN